MGNGDKWIKFTCTNQLSFPVTTVRKCLGKQGEILAGLLEVGRGFWDARLVPETQQDHCTPVQNCVGRELRGLIG